jgi:hypothetical protein
VPSTGLTTPEQDWVQPPGQGVFPESMGVYTRLDLFTRAFQPPAVKFQDLKAIVTSRLSANLLPFDARVDFIRVTDETVLTPITVQVANSDLQFQNKDGVMHGALEVYGEITSRGDHIVNTFEKSLVFNLPEHEFQEYQKYKAVYQEAIPLRPARYKLSLVLKDGLNGHIGSEELGIVVPSFSVNELTSSSLILADQIMPLPNSHVIYGRVGSGPFWIGGTKVRPSANSTFTRDQRLGIYMQVYNLGIDDKTHKPSLDVRYEVEKDGRLLVDKPGYDANLKKASQQFTAVMIMPLRELAPGKYTVQIKVTDNIKKQSVSPSVALELR